MSSFDSPRSPVARIPAPPRPARPILVVDDNDDDRDLLLRRLERAGVTNPVIACTNGEMAMRTLVERWENHAPETWPCLLFLDLHMPGKNGLEVLAWLQGRPQASGLKAVIISSSVDPDEMEQARHLGAAGFLVKHPSVECFDAIVTLANAVGRASVPAPREAGPVARPASRSAR